MDWLQEHANLISALASVGMLAVWLLYLQLFYRSFRRRRRPHLLVHQAGGFGLDALCLVANMSESAVYLATVLVDAERGGRRVTFQPGPSERATSGREGPLRRVHQGPLGQGDYLDLGRFRELLCEADARLPPPAEGDPADGGGVRFTVRVAAFVGSELAPAGAVRRFRVRGRGADADVRPTTVLPEQLSTSRQRRAVERWLEEAQRLDAGAEEGVRDRETDTGNPGAGRSGA